MEPSSESSAALWLGALRCVAAAAAARLLLPAALAGLQDGHTPWLTQGSIQHVDLELIC